MIFSVRTVFVIILIIISVYLTFKQPKYGLIVFIILFFARPGTLIEWFPPIYETLHLPKIFAILALISYFFHLKEYSVKFPFQMWLMLAFFLIICISRLEANTEVFAHEIPMEFLKMFIISFLMINIIKTEEDLKQVCLVILFVNFGMFLYHYYYYKTSWHSIFNLVTYKGLNRNEFGGNLASVSALTFYLFNIYKTKLKKLGIILCFISFVMGVILTYSRAAFLAIIIVSTSLALSSKHKFRIIIFLILLSIIMGHRISENYFGRMETIKHYEKDPSAMGRLATNKAAINIIKTHPLLGVGAGNYPMVFLDYTPEDLKQWVRPGKQIHNIYLQAASETGLIGFSIFISLIITSFINVLKVTRICYKKENLKGLGYAAISLGIALLSYCIIGLFNPGAYYGYFYVFLPLTTSLLNIAYSSNNKTNNKKMDKMVSY